MKQGAERFSIKTEDYAKGRPDFPKEIIDFLYENKVIDFESKIADIGSGTGRFTKLLLERGHHVYGVEPNNEMRSKAEELLSKFDNFTSISGNAENTTLPNKSLNLITVAQAFHWFDKEKCLVEFKRILKDNGKLFIIWDDLINDYNDFSKEFRNISGRFRTVEPGNNRKKISRDETIDEVFKDHEHTSISFDHELYQDFERIKAGALSASFAPKPDEDNYEEFIAELERVFNKYAENGEVCTAFRVTCCLGTI